MNLNYKTSFLWFTTGEGAIGFGAMLKRKHLFKKVIILNTSAFYLNRIPLRIWFCKLPFISSFLIRGLNLFAKAATVMASTRRLSASEKNITFLLRFLESESGGL